MARTRRIVTREFVENVAYIMGPSSACAQALAAAKDYEAPVFIDTGSSIVVAKDSETAAMLLRNNWAMAARVSGRGSRRARRG